MSYFDDIIDEDALNDTSRKESPKKSKVKKEKVKKEKVKKQKPEKPKKPKKPTKEEKKQQQLYARQEHAKQQANHYAESSQEDLFEESITSSNSQLRTNENLSDEAKTYFDDFERETTQVEYKPTPLKKQKQKTKPPKREKAKPTKREKQKGVNHSKQASHSQGKVLNPLPQKHVRMTISPETQATMDVDCLCLMCSPTYKYPDEIFALKSQTDLETTQDIDSFMTEFIEPPEVKPSNVDISDMISALHDITIEPATTSEATEEDLFGEPIIEPITESLPELDDLSLIEPLEELSELEPLEPLEPIEPLEPLEPLEELEDLQVIQPEEELDELNTLEPITEHKAIFEEVEQPEPIPHVELKKPEVDDSIDELDFTQGDFVIGNSRPQETPIEPPKATNITFNQDYLKKVLERS